MHHVLPKRLQSNLSHGHICNSISTKQNIYKFIHTNFAFFLSIESTCVCFHPGKSPWGINVGKH